MALPVNQDHLFKFDSTGSSTDDSSNRLSGYTHSIQDRNHSQRSATEAYIAKRFKAVHDARIDHFLPFFLTTSKHEKLTAAAGFSPGQCGGMFIEHYLEAPIEQLIARLEEQPVSRSQIVEIGNLVVTDRMSGLLLFVFLAQFLHLSGFKWMAFTATSSVEKMIQKLGYSPFYLADARADHLGDVAKNWGRYYGNNPRVMVGNLDQASAHITSVSGLNTLAAGFLEQSRRLATVWTKSTREPSHV